MNHAFPARARMIGRIGLVVAAVVAGLTVSSAPASSRPAVASPFVLEARDFAAFVNAQPPGPRTLIVTGTVVLPHEGHLVRLVPGRPGPDPAVLVLDLVVRPLPGRYVPRRTEFDVRFESTATVDVDTVVIRPLGLELPVSIVR